MVTPFPSMEKPDKLLALVMLRAEVSVIVFPASDGSITMAAFPKVFIAESMAVRRVRGLPLFVSSVEVTSQANCACTLLFSSIATLSVSPSGPSPGVSTPFTVQPIRVERAEGFALIVTTAFGV